MKVRYSTNANGRLSGGELEVRDLVVEDAQGNPIFLIVESAPGLETLMDFREPEFHATLKNLGLDKSVRVRNLEPQKVPAGYVPLKSWLAEGE